jgi:hypothetical protein
MKKVLVAAAGLMLAGTMVSSAMADVTFNGDARARYYNQSDYNLVDSADSFFNSRVRLQWKATTKGGAYVVGRFRLADAQWDGTQQNRKGDDAGNLWVDKAYIGVPFGPVTVEAGLTYRTLTDFSYAWYGADAVDVFYKGENTSVNAFLQVNDEIDEANATDDADDDDIMAYGLKLDQKFNGGFGLTAYGMFQDDNQADADGLRAGMKVGGAFGAATVNAEVAYVEADVQGTDDDGIGAYIDATIPVGAVSVYGIVGIANDGFVVDDDFAGQGIVMGNYEMIGGFGLGEDGDTTFVVVAPSYKASESLTLGASFGYANIDDDVEDADLFEIGARASYAVTDGASLNAMVGYVDVEGAEENPLGFGLELAVSF